MAATSPADCEWRRAPLVGRGGAKRGRARTPVGAVPRAHPITNSWRDASVDVIRRLGSHLDKEKELILQL